MTILSIILWSVLVLVVLVAAGFFARAVVDNPRDDPNIGFLAMVVRVYLRLVHRVRYEGLENIPEGRSPGRLVVVCNHTAGIDPMLVHAVVPFDIRWMMASDMRVPVLEPFWKWMRLIDVDRFHSDARSALEALRAIRRGEVLGIFPEGGLERPPRRLLPFMPGVGMLVKKTGARVLPVVIDGTPQVDPAFASLWHTSRAHVRFMPVIDYSHSGMGSEEIAHDLQRRYAAWTGWPINTVSAGRSTFAEA